MASEFLTYRAKKQKETNERRAKEATTNAAVDSLKQRSSQKKSNANGSSLINSGGVSVNDVEQRLKDSAISKAAAKTQTKAPMNSREKTTIALSETQKRNMPKNITVKNQNDPNARVVDQSIKNFNPNDPNYSTPADERSYRNTREGAYAYKHPIAGVASHVINNVGSGFEGLAGTAYQAVTGKKLDDQFFKGTYAAQDAQSGVRRRVQDATAEARTASAPQGRMPQGFLRILA